MVTPARISALSWVRVPARVPGEVEPATGAAGTARGRPASMTSSMSSV